MPARVRFENAGLAAYAHPPERRPVLVVGADEQADVGVGGNIRQPPQRPIALGLLSTAE
jgi:hypothetical protein